MWLARGNKMKDNYERDETNPCYDCTHGGTGKLSSKCNNCKHDIIRKLKKRGYLS